MARHGARTVHANDTFYDEINEVIQRETLSRLDDELRGTLEALHREGQVLSPTLACVDFERCGRHCNATARATFRSRPMA